MKSICVFCGSSDSVHADYKTAARQMGRTLAGRGIRLIYGGGRTGLMGALADGALEAQGQVIGVIIPSMNTSALAHQGLTRMDVTPDGATRLGGGMNPRLSSWKSAEADSARAISMH